MAYIKVHELKTWREYVTTHENMDLTPYIFRGQSNSINSVGEFSQWRLESSFNRFYTRKFAFSFSHILNQHLQNDLFKFHYGRYSYSKISEIQSLNELQKCFYLQHYGMPTCLIDFTHDPLIAMYFAMSGIQGSSGAQYDGDGNCVEFSTSPEKDYVTIYRLNHKVLREVFSISEITSENYDNWLSKYETAYHCSHQVNVKLALILNPEDKIRIDNFNLTAQKGCFLLFDNAEGLDIDRGSRQKVDLIGFLENHEKYYAAELPEPVLTVFNINYNAFIRRKERILIDGELDPKNISAFEFLNRKKLTGKYLFDDIQGLRYDFNFMHDVDR
jgi:hypothetical protein